VVGLGNPGDDYAHTRHNVGSDTVILLAARHGGRLKPGKERALTTEVTIDSKRVALAFPQTYVNDSGMSLAALVRRHGITDWKRIVIVHDELDLPPAELKVKDGGGLAGHNGLRSITQHLKTQDYLRVRIGVGKPPGGKDHGAKHVLKKLSKKDREAFDVTIELAADAVETIVTDGVEVAMNRYNTRT
jgi:PTH1 family peptidyl-tRNA hydrolase